MLYAVITSVSEPLCVVPVVALHPLTSLQKRGPRVPADAFPWMNADVVNAAKPIPPTATIATTATSPINHRFPILRTSWVNRPSIEEGRGG